MSDKSFLVVPFDRDANNALRPGPPARLETREAARFAAQQVASFHAGIAIIEERRDAFVEPRIVEILGSVSPATVAMFGTAARVGKCGRVADRVREFMNRTAGPSDVDAAQGYDANASRKRQALRNLPRSRQPSSV